MILRSLFLAAAFLAAPALAADNWVAYGQSDAGTFYFDPGTVRTEAGRKQVWRLFELKEARGDGVRSGKALVELDCKGSRFRYLRTMYYAGPMGRGKYLGGAQAQPTEPIGPGSTIGALAQKVC
ncbi:MAG TPA: surface-adhesin E family protein [Ramlibacter sp.]|nr:surface-adhesin E family protein [Ramlibacter sp.]